MNLPKISLITPSYNQGHFLRQTIESVLQQKYPNLEYRVIDGASSDESVSILRSYGDQVQWVSERDRGQTDALNKGFRQETGEIVGFLNADDLLVPGTLWEVAGVFQQNPSVSWVTGEYQIIDERNQVRDPLVRWYKRLQRNLISQFPGLFAHVLRVNNPVIQPSTFWRLEVHEKVGFLREEFDLVMDYEWWWRVYSHYGAPKVVPYVWSLFRVHADSKGGQYFRERLDEQWHVAKEYGASSAHLRFHRFHNRVTSWMYERGIA